MSIRIAPISEMVAQAQEAIAAGFKGVKIKIGIDRKHDIEAAAAIRSALGPEATVRVDANMGWRERSEALSVIRGARAAEHPFGGQPLPADRIADLAWLRDNSPIPIMVDESVWGPDDAGRVIEARAADIINVYVSEAGGLRNAARNLRHGGGGRHRVHDRQHARARHRHGGTDASRRRNAPICSDRATSAASSTTPRP